MITEMRTRVGTTSKRTPTWWMGASDEHYTVTKSSSVQGHDAEGSLASDSSKGTTLDVLDQPILVEALAF